MILDFIIDASLFLLVWVVIGVIIVKICRVIDSEVLDQFNAGGEDHKVFIAICALAWPFVLLIVVANMVSGFIDFVLNKIKNKGRK